MKYVTNQPFDFISPSAAFSIGLMQFIGGLAAELACILFLGGIDDPFEVIMMFAALASISKVDDFYFNALPKELRVKKPSKSLIIRIHKRDYETLDEHAQDCDHRHVEEMKKARSMKFKLLRLIYKILRIFYASWNFYFMPYTTLFLPYIAEYLVISS